VVKPFSAREGNGQNGNSSHDFAYVVKFATLLSLISFCGPDRQTIQPSLLAPG
jgi:hypothetical protein